MRKILFFATALLSLLSCKEADQWELVWEENFDGPELDASVWSRIRRGTPEWQDTQAPDDDRCFDMRDGMLILRGMVNDINPEDTAAYHTGGVSTARKHAFDCGRIEVRARLHGAQGAWPAIWMMPFDQTLPWPKGGEVDIMEHLNHDDIAYYTLHSIFSHDSANKSYQDSIPTGTKSRINPDDFNVYSVDFYPDSMVYHVNGERVFAYFKDYSIPEEKEQFPFYRPMFLMIDMQLRGSWPGPVDPKDLPVEMEVDWVRHYQLKNNNK